MRKAAASKDRLYLVGTRPARVPARRTRLPLNKLPPAAREALDTIVRQMIIANLEPQRKAEMFPFRRKQK